MVLKHIHYMPSELEAGILYVSKEYNTAAHLCACGCGSKIRTPLRQTEWSLVETNQGPTLRPSIGNWQQECQSHYLITKGEIKWAGQWTSEQIEEGRRSENRKRQQYYEGRASKPRGILGEIWNWVRGMFK